MPVAARLATLVLLLACVIGAEIWLWDRHSTRIAWPAQVQREVLGTTVVTREDMISNEQGFAWGQGAARWRYRADGDNPVFRRLCGGTPFARCSFVRSRKIAQGVDLSVSLQGGVLTVEEVWS